MAEPLDLSVVVPVYNEADSLPVLWPELRDILEPLALTFEVIFVDDGSRDASAEIVRRFCAEDRRVRLLRFRANAGETAATSAGLRAARGRHIVTMDGDLQCDPRDIAGLLAHLKEWDAVTGWRVDRAAGDSWVRRASSRIANRVRNALSEERIQDSGCTFRAFRRECLADLTLYTGFHRFIPTLLRMQGYRVLETPVTHRPRRFGRSKYGIGNRAVPAFVDLLVVRWMKRRRLRYEVAEVVGGEDRPVKVLLAGLGRWGEKHLRVLTELGVEVWVAEMDEGRRGLARAAGVPPARVLADVGPALAVVDAVDVVTPAETHLMLAGAALRAGRDCFVEKPMASTVAEGLALRDLVRETGRVLQVGHVFRFHPVTDGLRRHLEHGTPGRIRYCAGRFAGFKRPRVDGGITQSDAIHYFDLFAHLLGRRPTAVTATLHDLLGGGLDDISFTTVEYGDVPAFVEAGCFVPGTHRDGVIVGERATLAADFAASTLSVHGNRHVREPSGWRAVEGEVETAKATGPEPLHRELELFLEAVRERRAPAVDVEAGLLALRVVEAAQASAAAGRRITLP